MARKAVALFLLICGCLATVKAQNVSSCYFCQEDDAVCLDPVNVAILPSLRCAELNYGPRSGVIPEYGLSAQIRSIMQNDVEPRSRGSGDDIYQCVKLSVTINSSATNAITQGVFRTCVIKAPDVESVCDFMSAEISSNYTITYCDVCDGDKCNGSASFSALVGVVLLSLTGLLFK